MNLNKKMKCLLSAVLALVLLMSAAIAMPVTAAQSNDGDKTVQATENNTVIPDGRTELEELAQPEDEENEDATVAPEYPVSEEALPEIETAVEETSVKADTELAETGDGVALGTDVKPHRKGAYPNRIVLTWNKLAGVEGYRVYWRDVTKKNTVKKLLATVKANTLVINSLKRGAKYLIYVRPYITKNGIIREGKGSKAFYAATTPAPVKKLVLKSNGQSATVIQWKRVVGIDGYLLLRQHQGAWKAYKYLGINATQFKDTDVIPGHAYYYKIMTYRRDSRGYLKSSTAPLTTICGLAAPANDGSSSRGNKITFSWKRNRFASGYSLLYSTDNKNFKSLGNTTKTSYTTAKLKTGTKVYLRVPPYRIVGKSKTKVNGTTARFTMKAVASKYGTDTYIEIDISDQHMWYVVNNEVYVSTPVVTGNYDSNDTPTGTFYINDMSRDVSLVGADYVSFVEYWMSFIGSSYGIHDASWRSSFGGDIFRGNGSHGCVNTPYDAVKKIFNHASVGTKVIIHW